MEKTPGNVHYSQLWRLPRGSCELPECLYCWSVTSWMVYLMRASCFEARLVVEPAPCSVSCPSSRSRHTEFLTSSGVLRETRQLWLDTPLCRYWTRRLFKLLYSSNTFSSYPPCALKVELIHKTMAFPAPLTCPPRIQCFSYPSLYSLRNGLC